MDTTKQINNVILIAVEQGVVKQTFCTDQEAKMKMDAVHARIETAVCFTGDGTFGQELLLATSPGLQARVSEAMNKVQTAHNLKLALDAQGVPNERSLRAAISMAFAQLTGTGGLRG